MQRMLAIPRNLSYHGTVRFRGDLDALILGVLHAGPGHGYEIARRIERFGNGELSAAEGLLYPALHRLEGAGLLSMEPVAQVGKPDRRVYSLTEKGVRELETRRSAWLAFRDSVDRIMDGEKSHG